MNNTKHTAITIEHLNNGNICINEGVYIKALFVDCCDAEKRFIEKAVKDHNTVEAKDKRIEFLLELLEASDNNFSRTTGADHYYKGVKMSKHIEDNKGAGE